MGQKTPFGDPEDSHVFPGDQKDLAAEAIPSRQLQGLSQDHWKLNRSSEEEPQSVPAEPGVSDDGRSSATYVSAPVKEKVLVEDAMVLPQGKSQLGFWCCVPAFSVCSSLGHSEF